MTRRKPADSVLPQQIVDAIRKAWPDGIVDVPDTEDAPLSETYPTLKASLSHIPGARVLYEREPQSVPDWDQDSDEEEESPDLDEGSRSYWLFFLSPADKRFEFGTETIEPDEEDGVERRFPGQGWIGCIVAISVVAPFAAVSLDELEVFDNGSRYEPDVEPHMFNVDGGKLDLENHFGEMVEEEGLLILKKLRSKIVRVLEKSGIAVIPEADLDRPVPWLRGGEEVLVGQAGEPITVRRAFFFRCL